MDKSGDKIDLYLFDVTDDGVLLRDEFGMALSSWDEARQEAKILACEIMRDREPSADERIVYIDVRTVKAGPVYRTRVEFKAGWISSDPV